MNITINNCNNIDSGVISVEPGKLNIKYAINGSGKSSIAKAIRLWIESPDKANPALSSLIPFKHTAGSTVAPNVSGIENLNSVKCFDENYIQQFLFQPDELVKGSFDIFMRDEAYERSIEDVNRIVRGLQEAIAKDSELTDFLRDLSDLIEAFGKPNKTGGMSGTSVLAKAWKDGNKVENIPNGLEGYSDFIKHADNYKWIKWQTDGAIFLNISANCPYCTSAVAENKATIEKVSASYSHKVIENLNKIVASFTRLGKYFSDGTKAKVNEFVTNIGGYTKDQERYLTEIRDQIIELRSRFESARVLGFTSLKDAGKTQSALLELKIDISTYSHLNSDETRRMVSIVNDGIDAMLAQASVLQGKVNLHKARIAGVIKEYGNEINRFLQNAGYKYRAELVPDPNDQHKLKLKHLDRVGNVDDVKDRLSYGERNAFALVLFMFEAVKAKPDLVILDDPISSFDKHKKFAIMEMLFAGSPRSLRDKTVLLLTHDFDPIVDIIYHHRRSFQNATATFLANSNGVIKESAIKKDNILSFYEINTVNASLGTVSSLVYLRRMYEAMGSKGIEWNYLSSLLHRNTPCIRQDDVDVEMTAEQIAHAVSRIKEFIPEYDNNVMTALIMDDDSLLRQYKSSTSGYEKLHLYRIYHAKRPRDESKSFMKFINESCHIENDYIYQLNPKEYQIIPQFVVDECDSAMAVAQTASVPGTTG